MDKNLELMKLYFTKKLGFQAPDGETVTYDGEIKNENRLALFNRDINIRIYIELVDGEYEMTISGRPNNNYDKYIDYFLNLKSKYYDNKEYNQFCREMDKEMQTLISEFNS